MQDDVAADTAPAATADAAATVDAAAVDADAVPAAGDESSSAAEGVEAATFGGTASNLCTGFSPRTRVADGFNTWDVATAVGSFFCTTTKMAADRVRQS
jgi:hypothetical protein